MQAFGAGLRTVGRRHSHNPNPCPHRLVLQKRPQLVERPTVRPPTLCLGARLLVGTLPNPSPIFQSNDAVGRPCPGNEGLGEAGVHPGLEATLPARQPLPDLTASTPTRPCALTGFALQRRPQAGGVVSDLVQLLSIPVVSCRGVGNVCSTQIHAQNPLPSLRFWHFFLNLYVDIKLAIFAFDQSRFLAPELLYLVVAQNQGNVLSPVMSGEADALCSLSIVKDTGIVVSRSGLEILNRAYFADSGDPGTDPDSQVGG